MTIEMCLSPGDLGFERYGEVLIVKERVQVAAAVIAFVYEVPPKPTAEINDY